MGEQLDLRQRAADALAAALVAYVLDGDVTPVLDDALAAALADAIDLVGHDLAPGVPPVAAELLAQLIVDLVIDVRDAASSLARWRLAAMELRARLAVVLADPGAPAGLVRLLDALVRVPAGDDGLIDAVADPERPVEQAIVAWRSGGAREPVRAALSAAEVFVPVLDADLGDEGLALQLVPVHVAGHPHIAVCTGRERLGEVLGPGAPTVALLTVRGHELTGLCPPGAGVVLDPGTSLEMALDGNEVAGLSVRACR